MPTTALPSYPCPPDDAADKTAWRAMLAAATWARGHTEEGASSTAFAVTPAGELAVVRAGSAQAWLVWSPDSGWAATPAVPAQARALFDLYLPICAASARRPLAVGHLGQSLDGYIATAAGDSYYVTGPQNVRHLHRLRALCDAVVVGAETVARDDPRLTVRQAEGANPVRVILDPRRRLPAHHRVFRDAEAPTLVVCDETVASSSSSPGAAQIMAVPTRDGRLQLDALLDRLRARGLQAVFIEGGGATVSGFLEAGLLDRLHVAIAPLVMGNGRPGIRLPPRERLADCLRPAHRVFAMGADVLFDCDLRASAAAL